MIMYQFQGKSTGSNYCRSVDFALPVKLLYLRKGDDFLLQRVEL